MPVDAVDVKSRLLYPALTGSSVQTDGQNCQNMVHLTLFLKFAIMSIGRGAECSASLTGRQDGAIAP